MIVHAYVYQLSRRTAFIKGWMTSEDGKTIYAACDHHKIYVPLMREFQGVEIPWDDLWDENGQEKPRAKL